MRGMCLLHLPELLIQRLLVVLDGTTKGKDKLTSGPIGEAMRMIEKGEFNKKPVAFEPVSSPTDLGDKVDAFNRDMQTLFVWSRSITNGKLIKIYNAFN